MLGAICLGSNSSFLAARISLAPDPVAQKYGHARWLYHNYTHTRTPEPGGQKGQLPLLPFAGRGKGSKSAL